MDSLLGASGTLSSNRLRRYKLSPGQFVAMAKAQNMGCAICGVTPPIVGKLVVDHNHATGEIRGLLCRKCNLGLGTFQDNPHLLNRASEYLLSAGDYSDYVANGRVQGERPRPAVT